MSRFLIKAAALAIAIQWGATTGVLAQEAAPLAIGPAATRASLPALPFKRLDGNPASLADYKGKVVVLNLWATWCAPCKKEMPSLARLQAGFPKDHLVVLAASVDRGDDSKVENFVDAAGLTDLEILRDAKMAVPRELTLPGIPATLIIDKEGREAARILGDRDWDAAPTIATLKALVDEAPPG
ncbi:Thiol-disulfide isomerase or thioredoxin [Arboricoccus pini]|uniref:Thiol-disulfide isomerase or thioredoxin n=1 Tax=Arboricoccus pini TaxID=1963835 RepID=A0A212Q9Q1_9PROT|nr:TlpA disulfide reductase family protein [Arboricoccus pini]SNB56019.1 Thiol-disulfide isomerase or thioredoxin [Arboricoccus pini]